MNLIETGLEGLTIIEPSIFTDDRGYFYEAFNLNSWNANGIRLNIAQTNISLSKKDVIRGLHFQNPPFAQGKLVRVLRGAVLDVVVDIRTGSPTYGKHFSVELNEENKLSLWVPVGFAHGFAALSDDTLFHYDCTQVYHKDSEGSILWNDPDLDIDWGVDDPIVSEKDKDAIPFKRFQSMFSFETNS